jgi:hypothetical protein
MEEDRTKLLFENYENMILSFQKTERFNNALLAAMEEWLDDEMLEKIATTVKSLTEGNAK